MCSHPRRVFYSLFSLGLHDRSQKMVASGGFWLSAVAVPAVVNVADLLLLAVNTQLFTSQTHAAREWEVVAPHKDATGRPTSSRIS